MQPDQTWQLHKFFRVPGPGDLGDRKQSFIPGGTEHVLLFPFQNALPTLAESRLSLPDPAQGPSSSIKSSPSVLS